MVWGSGFGVYGFFRSELLSLEIFGLGFRVLNECSNSWFKPWVLSGLKGLGERSSWFGDLRVWILNSHPRFRKELSKS